MLTQRLLRISQPLLARSSSSSVLTAQQTSSASRAAALSTTTALRAGDHGGHESHYNPPGGWLWGERPGEKYEKEGWEGLFYWGFCGSWIVAVVAYTMKEDTSIQTWALEEARRRLEKEGILEDTSE